MEATSRKAFWRPGHRAIFFAREKIWEKQVVRSLSFAAAKEKKFVMPSKVRERARALESERARERERASTINLNSQTRNLKPEARNPEPGDGGS
jgi:hypothetical protein